MQMLRNFVGCDYSTDEGTDSEDEQVSGGEEHVGTGGEIKWIESEKGRPMLVCGGFSYYHHYDAKEKIDGVLTPVSVYHCVEYQSHCKAKVWIRDGNYHKRSTDGHNHCGDPIEVGSRVVRHKGKVTRVHFYKAIIEHIGEAGLKEKYDEVPAFNMFVRSFPALALIHPDHIDAAFADIKERAKGFKGEGYEGMNKFMEYFEPTWIRKVNSRGIVTEALFPRKFWNHHDAALKDEAKTTCGLEEWHKDMKSAINKYPQKTLWYLLMHLKDQFGNVSPNRVIQLESPSQNKRLPKQKEQRAEILRKALNDFDPLDVKSSLVRVARASRYDDKKDPVPKRVGTKRHRAPDDDEEGWDDGGADAAPTTLTAVRHMCL